MSVLQSSNALKYNGATIFVVDINTGTLPFRSRKPHILKTKIWS
jgi:hypothetical protein